MIGRIPDNRGFSLFVLIEKRVFIDKKGLFCLFFFLMYRFCNDGAVSEALE